MTENRKQSGKIIIQFRTFVLIKIEKFVYHWSFFLGNNLHHGSLNFSRNKFRVLPLFLTISIVCGLILFGINSSSAMMEPEFTVMENDFRDKEAKKANDKYLDDSDKQKMAVITAEEIRESEEDKKKKLTVSTYIIQPGDTLSEIANHFGVPMDSIAGSSGIGVESVIKPGQELLIPNKKGIVYRIKTGDTLASVALKYKVKIDEVLAENNLEHGDILRNRSKLFLPGAVAPESKSSWRVPVASHIVTSGFGWRRFPRRKFHDALDLKARYEPVRASKGGKVIYSGWMGGYGNTVIIQHPGNIKTLYAHNSRLYVKSGQYVSKGKTISKSGCTGFCFGPHLHFEVIKNGRSINPKKYLRGLRHKR